MNFSNSWSWYIHAKCRFSLCWNNCLILFLFAGRDMYTRCTRCRAVCRRLWLGWTVNKTKRRTNERVRISNECVFPFKLSSTMMMMTYSGVRVAEILTSRTWVSEWVCAVECTSNGCNFAEFEKWIIHMYETRTHYNASCSMAMFNAPHHNRKS